MRAGCRSLLPRRRSTVPNDRPVIQIEDHREKYISAGHAILLDRRAAGSRRPGRTSILQLHFCH